MAAGSIPGLSGPLFPSVQVVAAMSRNQIGADRDDDDRHVDSTERRADGYQDDAIALAEKRARESRPQRLGLALGTRPSSRNVSSRVNVPTRAATPHHGSHSFAPIKPAKTAESVYALQKLSKNDPNDDWRPQLGRPFRRPHRRSRSARRSRRRGSTGGTRRSTRKRQPKTMPENESRCGDTRVAVKARPSGIASLESGSL